MHVPWCSISAQWTDPADPHYYYYIVLGYLAHTHARKQRTPWTYLERYRPQDNPAMTTGQNSGE